MGSVLISSAYFEVDYKQEGLLNRSLGRWLCHKGSNQ